MNKLLNLFFKKSILKEAEKIANQRTQASIEKLDKYLLDGKVKSRVYILDSEENNKISDDLGISPERLAILDKAINKAITDQKTYTEAMEVVSMRCNNLQELGYICFIIGGQAIKNNTAKNSLTPALNALGIDPIQMMQNGSVDIDSMLDALSKKTGAPKEMLKKMYEDWRRKNNK